MDVAAELMYLRGVRATGIQEIIDAARAGKSQLYVEDAVFAGEETKRVGFSEADRADQ